VNKIRRIAISITGMCMVCALASPVHAQRGVVAKWKPIPRDVSPRVNPAQCGGFEGHFGPFDFRSVHPDDRRVVEQYHFDMELRTFLSGQVVGRNRAGTSAVAGGFDYVLKAIPNHPAALLVMEQLGRKLKSENPQNLELPLECYYVQAFMIAPDDPAVRALYGIYLAHRGRSDEAIYHLDLGDSGLRTSGPLQHSIGTANMVLARFEKAQLNALRAKRYGFPLDTVEKQLRNAGKWNPTLVLPPDDLPPEEPSPAASAVAGGATPDLPAAHAASAASAASAATP
jgi:hypothetical protein